MTTVFLFLSCLEKKPPGGWENTPIVIGLKVELATIKLVLSVSLTVDPTVK